MPVSTTQHSIALGSRQVDYLLRNSPSAKKMRIRIGPNGMTVTLPASRQQSEVEPFLRKHSLWIEAQWERVEALRQIRRPQSIRENALLFRGNQTPICLEEHPNRFGAARISQTTQGITIIRSAHSPTPPARTLENWLRKQARQAILSEITPIASHLNVKPHRVYLMDQRTKWGACSSQGNLSFNWRLILAPPFVLRYLVIHETVHLAIPDHSRKFWLAVQSLCPETERARQWLSANAAHLKIHLNDLFMEP